MLRSGTGGGSWRSPAGLSLQTIAAARPRRLADFKNHPGRKLKPAYRFRNSPMISGREGFPAIFARRHAGGFLEGAVEWPERLEARIHRNRDHGDLGLRRVGQRRLGLLDAVVVQERIEIAIAEPLV